MIDDGSLWLWCVLFAVAAVGFAIERSPSGKYFSGAVVCLSAALLLANLGFIPKNAATYDIVGSGLVSIAIPLLLFQADLRRILRESGVMLYCSLIGSVATAIGGFVAFAAWSHQLGQPLAARLAGVYAATYIGGTMNYVAVSQAVEITDAQFAAGLAADNIITALFLVTLALLPASGWFRRMFSRPDAHSAANAAMPTEQHEVLDVVSLTIAIALACAIAAIGTFVGQRTGIKFMPVMVTTFLTVVLSTLVPAVGRITRGSFPIGMILMYVFFVTVGAGADIAALLTQGALIFAFAGTVVIVHLVLTLPIVAALGLPLRESIIGSCATLSGPTVAAAMAASKGWHDLVVPAVLTGILGYIMANAIGLAIFSVLR